MRNSSLNQAKLEESARETNERNLQIFDRKNVHKLRQFGVNKSLNIQRSKLKIIGYIFC